MTASVGNAAKPLRVVFQQPALPAYRVPLFARLAVLPGVTLSLLHGSEEPALANAPASGFDARLSRQRSWFIPGVGPLFWHDAHWRATDPSRADLAVLSWNTRYLSLLPALLRARWRGVPTALWGHGFSKTSTSRWRGALRRLPARLATAVIVYDAATAERLVADGYERSRVHVAPNGLIGSRIDAARRAALDESETSRQAWRKRWGLAAGPMLLHLGRLDPASGLFELVDALASLREHHRHLQLALVGQGPEVIEALRERAARLGLPSNALVTPGPVYDELDVARWMRAASVFVYPRNAGLSIVHAANYGVPLVVAAPLEAHNPEIAIVEAGVTGIVASSCTSVALADAIDGLLREPARACALGDAARARVGAEHDVAVMVERFAQAFEALRGRAEPLV